MSRDLFLAERRTVESDRAAFADGRPGAKIGWIHSGISTVAALRRRPMQPQGRSINPAHSISHALLAAPLAKLGRLEEAKAAANAFRYSRQFSGVDCTPALAASLSEALHEAGLRNRIAFYRAATARSWRTSASGR